MIEFGRTLRVAREAKGSTIAQITEMTHMAPLTVEALEATGRSKYLLIRGYLNGETRQNRLLSPTSEYIGCEEGTR